MAQRAALATVVEFFTRGKRNLFKFAFESKRKGESDYNAFVRANINRVPVQSRKNLVENAPVFGAFVLSQGSLTQPAFWFDGDHPMGVLETRALPAAGAALTIGQLSKAIADLNGLQDGDIITIVGIHSEPERVNSELADAIEYGGLTIPGSAPIWTIRQFTLDMNSEVKVSTLDIFDLENVTAGQQGLNLSTATFMVDGEDGAFPDMLAVIASRNTPSGLKVSTSTCAIGASGKGVFELGMSDEWKVWVAKHWNDATSLDVAPDNILEGSISEN